jgi:hypothetical protein
MIVMEEVRLYKDSNRALRGPGSGCEAHQAAYLRPSFNVSSLTDSGTSYTIAQSSFKFVLTEF